MPIITCCEDLRQLAQKRVPKAFYDYADSGSYTESTYRSNEAALSALKLRQRVAINVNDRSTASTLLGVPVSMPLAIAPTGLAGMQWANGEILGARAAEAQGVPFTLSTMSICSIEDVAQATTQPFWFQLYVMRDREFTASLIDRAKAARCSALMLTLDLQVMGQRHKDLHNGMTVPLRPSLSNLLNLACRPGWMMRMATAKRHTFGNLAGYVKNADGINSLGRWIANQFDPSLSWADVAWIKERWGGKLILKGILDPDDARRAIDCGADAIVVSNHGGRQLDGAIPSITALPAIAAAVGHQTELLFDGGVRSGQDVFRALALGAQGTLIGRAFLYGLGALGEVGVTTVLDLIRKELDVSMALTGNRRIHDITDQSLMRS